MVIILNILSTMFYVFEEINWRWCRHNTLLVSHIRITASAEVIRRQRGDPSQLGPPLNSPLERLRIQYWTFKFCQIHEF